MLLKQLDYSLSEDAHKNMEFIFFCLQSGSQERATQSLNKDIVKLLPNLHNKQMSGNWQCINY